MLKTEKVHLLGMYNRDNSQGSVENALGKAVRRISSVTAERARTRTLIINDCEAARADIGRDISKEVFEVYVYEWKSERPFSGKRTPRDWRAQHQEVVLPHGSPAPEAFGQLWAPRDAYYPHNSDQGQNRACGEHYISDGNRTSERSTVKKRSSAESGSDIMRTARRARSFLTRRRL